MYIYICVSVKFGSVAQSCPTPCHPMHCSTSGLPVHHQLPELTQTHVHWVCDAIQPCHPLSCLLPLPLIFPSIRVFSNELALHIRWPKDWSFTIIPATGYSGLISFRIDWFDLLAVQGNLKSLLQHHSLKASVPWCSAFFMVQPSHSCKTTGKTIALTAWAFVCKVMSLLFNMLSRFVIAFLSRSKCPLISCTCTICSDFGAQENKVCHCFNCFPIYLRWSDGTRCHDLSFLNVEF